MSLPPDLWKAQQEIKGYARDYGLDFFETVFEVVDYKKMNEIAAYGGYPTRYPHWRFGMDYERLSKSYAYGLHKIYEMVINNDPCYAYLLEGNHFVDQKLVIAHVYGHCDFFKNNYWFSKTNRKMIDDMANHAAKIQSYIDKYGHERVEEFIDVCLSLDNLIDYHSPFIQRSRVEDDDEGSFEEIEVPKIKAKSYMDEYINPKEFLQKQKAKIEEERQQKKKFPPEPAHDVMTFLIQHAPLERWERITMDIIRKEAYFFAPQMMTKIMNEGWASYWHSRIMTEKALEPSEFIDFADHHSGTMAVQPGQLNPYKLGIELFRDIEDRWNKGKFGKEYEECDSMVERENWDRKLGLGRQKIFEVRKIYNDITFLDAFLTREFCSQQKMFTYDYNKKSNHWEISSREFKAIKERLLGSLTNFGQPYIHVDDANFENRGELLLIHRHEGVDLRLDYARDVMGNIQKAWKRPVNLATTLDGKNKLLTHDGTNFEEKK